MMGALAKEHDMKTQRIVAAVAAASLAFSSAAAFAQSTGAQDQAQAEQRDRQAAGRATPADEARLDRAVRQGRANADDTRGQYRGDQRNQYRGDDRQANRGNDRQAYRGDDRQAYRGNDRGGARGDGRGAGPEHAWYRGQRLPNEYRDRQYVVDDWRSHHLSAPPRGYHWVQAGGDYVLVAIATGIIASFLLNQ
jgi:Ni/Co efflux regulator RcnB